MTAQISRRGFGVLAGAAGLATLAACSKKDPLATNSASSGSGSAASGTLVVGSQQYYSNEIIAELYAQVLEKAGFTITRQYQIGQREAYMPEIKSGKIDVFPEYSGNLLQFLDKSETASDATSIAAALGKALPSGIRALKAADATDQDSYNVTKDFATKNNLSSLADLAKLGAIKIAGNSELAKRPYGPDGLKAKYGVSATVTPVEDSGGPLTVKALTSGKVQAADIYSADPSIAKNGFVTLKDPKNLVLPQNVTPIVSQKVTDAAAAAIEKVNAALSVTELQALNAQSVNEQKKSADIASAWLKAKGLV